VGDFGLRRRDLLRGALAAPLALSPLARAAADSDPGVRRYVRLGRTGLEVSDVSFGSSRMRDPRLVEYALDRGINYFDTAESYQGGAAEEAIGRALSGKRERVILASKVVAGADNDRTSMMRALEGSLRRLRTDRIDVYFNHAVNEVARLRNPEWLEFTSRAKAQGKIRFPGMSGHGGRLIECLDFALDQDLADVILVAYNFGQDPAFYSRLIRGFDFVALQPELPRALEKARAKDVGVVAMKTLMGARLNDLRAFEAPDLTFAQAGLRWVLGDPKVHALVISMQNRAQIDEYLGASGQSGVPQAGLHLLERYLARNGGSYCRHGCDACHGACPHGVEIAEVLRARMYATHYEDPALARETYAALGSTAAACVGCSAPCSTACPHGLTVGELTRSAHALLA
jgi:predicted aldo/keto reductase-like oxidoreductase